VWHGRAADVEGAPAYWPFITMLREALSQSDGVPWLALMGDGAADLAQALSDLRAWLPAPQPMPDIEPAAARFRFFDSMLRFFRRACQHAPMLIMIDDLQLADAPSIQLFAFLARHADDGRLLLTAAIPQSARTREAEHANHDLQAVRRYARHVHVPAFGRDEVASFIAAHAGEPADSALVTRLAEHTGGNPLLLSQLLHVCRPASPGGQPRWEALDTLTESYGLHSAIARLVSELSAPAHDCLRTAALLGRRFARALLAELLEASPERIIAWLEETSATGLTVGADDPSGHSSFTHGLVRDALARGHDPERSRQLHERAAELLAGRHARGLAESSEVAYHYLRARCYERALHFSLLAARAATEHLAAGAALPHYEAALEALSSMPADAVLHASVLLEQADALKDAGQLRESRAVYMRVIRLARTQGCKTMLARAALGLDAPVPNDLDAEAVDLLREALAALDAGDEFYALVACALAKALCLSRDAPARGAGLTRALTAARREQDPLLRARALSMCHEAMSEPDELAERVEVSRELSELTRDLTDPQLCFKAARAELQDALALADIETLDVSLNVLEQIAERMREPFARWHAKTYRSMCAMLAGRVELALELAEQAYELGTPLNEPAARHAYLIQACAATRLLGDHDRSRELVYEAVSRYPTMAAWRCALALREVDAGHLNAARKMFEALMAEGLPTLKRDPFVLSLLCPMGELCVWVDDSAAAAQIYEWLTPYAAHWGTIGYGVLTTGPVARYLGMLAAQRGQFERAAEHFEASALTAARMRSPTFMCATALSHAWSLQGARCSSQLREAALAQLEVARELADKHGFGRVTRIGGELARSATP
jgi:predicted ATPase